LVFDVKPRPGPLVEVISGKHACLPCPL